MSLRDVYEAVLIEMNKENAPNILLEDFNYFLNKSISQFVNKKYNIYDINQQVTDDLSVLKDTYVVEGEKLLNGKSKYGDYSKIHNGTYRFELPADYFHILNCVCTYEAKKSYRCYDQGTIFEIGATRLTADQWNQVVNNFWNKPTYRRPYYYIHYGSQEVDPLKRNSTRLNGERKGNSQKILCEVRIGTDSETVFDLKQITIDYLKVPMYYRLTQNQIDCIEDTSSTLEFPDYVCQEIVNELVTLIMENVSDPKLLTFPVVSQSIANPAQQQTPQTAVSTAQ